MRNSRIIEYGHAKTMTMPIMGRYAIYVDGPSMGKNIAEGLYEPVLIIRETSSGDIMKVRDAFWQSPSRFVFREAVLPGTETQGWIETDGPILACVDGEKLFIIDGEAEKAKSKKASTPTMGGMTGKRVIHLDVPTMRENRASGSDNPVIAIRDPKHRLSKETAVFCREAAWFGPTRITHRTTVPIPNTNGRGSAFVETDASVTAFMASGIPQVIG